MKFKRLAPEEVGMTLNKVYDSEINFEIRNFWDGGFDFEVGDNVNGFKDVSEEIKVESQKYDLDLNKIEDTVSLMCYFITHIYPHSEFTKWYERNLVSIDDKAPINTGSDTAPEFTCKVCGKTFLDTESLYEHYDSTHNR